MNAELMPLLKMSFDAFEQGNHHLARIYQRRLDSVLKEQGGDPLAFWANLSQMSNEHWGTDA